MGTDIRSVNLWMALSHCGDEAPGLDIVPRRLDHIVETGDVVFRHACQLGFEGIVSKRLGSPYHSGRSRHWIKMKNPNAAAVKREAEEEWD